MKSGRSNKFSRALGHLKSTTIDEKLQLQLLSEIPTNNTQGAYTDEPDRTVLTTLNPHLNPVDLTIGDTYETRKDTSGLFMPDGTILTEEPPGDTSYILGPMAAMFYTWDYPWTMIGYIRQSDRKMVNLGRIDGRLDNWDGSVGQATSGSGTFRSYGQLTLEQALWFRDVQKQPGATNDPLTYNYYAYYPGPPSYAPDAFLRYPCLITGISKRRDVPVKRPPIPKPINPDWGLSGYMFIKNEKTGKWEKKYYYNDGTVSSERSGEMTPDNPFYDAYIRGGGDEAAENGYSRDEIIRAGNEQIQREADQQAQQDYQDTLRNMSDKPLTIDDFKRAADYSAYKNGGGDAARLQGKSVEEIINQGIQNINQYNQDPRISQGMADALDVKNSNSLGDKIIRFFGDLGDLAQGKVINSTDYNTQLAINLTKSVITGSPQEITLGDGAKRDQINSVDPNALGDALQIGTAPTPNASNAVNPTPGMKSDKVLKGGWGAQGGSEFSYDPVTDTFTITSNKMLRTGQAGDQFDITKGGRTVDGQVVDPGKQTAFGDIPDVDPKVVDQKAKEILDNPVVKGYLNTLGTVVGATQGTGNLYQELKNNPDAYEKFENDLAQVGRNIARGGVQGSASNAVAIRKALTDLGFPKSETENMGAGYGQVFSQTEYKGSEIPKEIRNVINQKTRQNESFGGYTRKRILREIKKETILPDEKKEKLKGYRPKTYGSLHTQYDKLMQKAENPASFKPMDETVWTKRDKYFNSRLSQERKNEVLDHIGTSDHYWDILCETGKKSREKGLQEKYGDYTLVRKEHLAGDTLLFLVDENGKKESILQSEYSDRIARQIEEPLWEQETLNAPNDPLIKRIRGKLATQINYPDKPSPMGYPDGPTPEQIDGYHPEYGKRAAYYNALDPQSADAMPATGDPEIDAKVNAQKTPLKKKSRKEIKEEARLIQSNWREETQLQESDWTPVAGSIANTTGTTFEYPGGSRVTVSGLGGVETTPSTVTVNQFGDVFDVPGPNFSQLGLQGYVPPLGNVNRRRDYEDVNPKLDASQEFASAVKSDVLMNARVQNPKTTSVGYFSYMTPAEQLEQARDAKERFAGGLGNPNFNDHVKGVIGYEKYQQLDDQRKANEESATKGIWDQWKEATRSGKYELAKKLQKQAEQIQSKIYRSFVDKVEVLYFDEFKKQTGLDPFGRKKPTDTGLIPNYTPTPDAPEETPDFDSGLIPNYTPTPDAPEETPDDDVLDQLASLPGLASAKNFIDHYIDNFVLGDGKQDQNLTNLLSKDDLNYLKNALGKDTGINNPKINRLSAPNSLYNIMQNAPRGIRNSIGNGATLDVDYFNRTGDYKIDKDYVFTQEADLEYRGLPGNLLLKPLIDAPKNYAKLKMGGDISPLIQNPMRFHVIIPGPRRKKEEELGKSTFDRLKKYR